MQAMENQGKIDAMRRTDADAGLDTKSEKEVINETISAFAAEKFDLGDLMIGLSDMTIKFNLMDHSKVSIAEGENQARNLFMDELSKLDTEQLKTINKNMAESNVTRSMVEMIPVSEMLKRRLTDDNPDKEFPVIDIKDNIQSRGAAVGKTIQMNIICGAVEMAVNELLIQRGIEPQIAQNNVIIKGGWDGKGRAAAQDPEIRADMQRQQQEMEVRDKKVFKFSEFIVAHGGDVREAVLNIRSGKGDEHLADLMMKPDFPVNPKMFGKIEDEPKKFKEMTPAEQNQKLQETRKMIDDIHNIKFQGKWETGMDIIQVCADILKNKPKTDPTDPMEYLEQRLDNIKDYKNLKQVIADKSESNGNTEESFKDFQASDIVKMFSTWRTLINENKEMKLDLKL